MSDKPHNLDVQPGQWRVLQAILEQYVPQYEAWAFGSRTDNTARPYSDLDIVIVTSHALPLADLAALKEAFSESDLPWKVDVLDWATISEPFREIIENHKVVLQNAG